MRTFKLCGLIFLACGLGLDARLASREEITERLEQYLGSWTGEVTVQTIDGEVMRKFPVAAEYWKVGESIRALTAFEVDGEMTFVEARNYLRNGLLFADVTQAGEKVIYRGTLKPDQIIWIPYDAELNTERRMREWFSEEADGTEVLNVEGVELLRSMKGIVPLILRAAMKRQ
ncbi:MAG: hypothetical protein AAGJ81_09895 [Verrucomicrobiota bacterium]